MRTAPSGGYRVFSLRDARGPAARGRASSTCSPPSAAGRRAAAARSCRGPSRSPTPTPTAACGSTSCSRAIGPGTERLCALEPGERVWVNGPLGNAFSEPRELAPGGRRGDPGRRRHRRRAAGAAAPPPRRPRRARPDPARLPRPRPLAAASTTSSPTARSASPPRTATSASAATSPTCWRRCSRATTRPAPPSTPAARRRCWRRCGRCAPARGVACELALESPMACGFGACFGCAVPLAEGGYMRLCVDGPVVARRADRGGAPMPELLRHRARAPGHQRLGDLRRDRRPAGLRRRPARATSRSPPSSRRRSPRSRGSATSRSGSGRRRPG